MGSTNNTIEEEEGKQQLSEKERNSPGGCFHKELFFLFSVRVMYVTQAHPSWRPKKSIIITAVYNYVAFPSCHDIFHNLLLLLFVQRCQTRV